jgi:tetratricopeptide (TPR) repeat protein
LSPRDAGQNLSADVVVAGELLARGKELTVRAELIDVRSGALLWGRRFDESADAIVNIQEQIARDVRGALRQKENEFPAATNDPEAFRLYLRGRYFWNKRSAEGLHRAAEQFQAAIDRDPSFAQAWVGLGDSYALLEQYAGIPSRDNCAKAKSAVLRAQELDPQLAQAQASLGLLYAHCEWNWTASEQAFRRAIELDPNYPTAHHWYALHLSYRGRFDEALREARRAQELDPLSLIASNAVSVAQGYAGHWPAVVEQSDRLIDMDPNFAVAHMWKGRALRASGSFDQSIAEFQRAVDLSGGKSAEMMGELASTYAVAGKVDDARKVIERLRAMEDTKHSAAYSLAASFASLGNRDEAFVWLDRALDDRSWFLVQLRVEPLFASLRNDPRFQADLNRVHLGTE